MRTTVKLHFTLKTLQAHAPKIHEAADELFHEDTKLHEVANDCIHEDLPEQHEEEGSEPASSQQHMQDHGTLHRGRSRAPAAFGEGVRSRGLQHLRTPPASKCQPGHQKKGRAWEI